MDLLGDQAPRSRPRRVVTRGREHRDEAERAAPLPRDRRDLFEGVQVPRLSRAEEQRDRSRDAGRQCLLEDRQDWREPASPRDEHQGRVARSQPELPRGTVDADRLADDVLVVDPRREASTGHLAHEERDLPVVPGGAANE